ncbi:MAG: hypothetical protein NC122_07400 [Faecalibacterium sp.]|nr:hypothetical protein [Ruminococcus sp.]MCM1392179.1 hypothetical protein [Ruminococcus sp.]MCM1486017.1 hypothetical protein [Faecalibacterium sp.]
MAREKADYRGNLELILQSFPNEHWLNMKQIFIFLGITRNTFNKRYPTIRAKGGCTPAELARILSD